MRAEKRIRDWSFALIVFIAACLLLGFALAIAGVFYRWSGFASHFAETFYFAGLAGVVLILAFTLVNLSANLNIISKIKISETEKTNPTTDGIPFYKVTGGFFLIYLICVGAIWFGEHLIYRNRVSELSEYADIIAEDGNMVNKIAESIYAPKRKDYSELSDIFDTMQSISGDCCIEIIAPKTNQDHKVYVQIRDPKLKSNKNYKEIQLLNRNLPIYTPTGIEKDRFDQLKSKEINHFSVLSKDGQFVRYYRMFNTKNGAFILSLSTETQSKSDFGRISANITP